MSKHTPGPWEVEEDDYGDELYFGGAGCGLISVNGWHAGGCKSDPEKWATLKANARLIAAVPDLLAVTQGFRRKLVTYVSVYPGDKELCRLLHECDAAIAKATGENV